MLTKTQAQALLSGVLKHSKFTDCTVSIAESDDAHLRFANNGVTTSGNSLRRTVTISSTREGKTGLVRLTEVDEAKLRDAVRRSEDLADTNPANPENMPPLGPQAYPDQNHWDDATAKAHTDVMGPQVKKIIDAAVSRKLVAAGFFERSANVVAFGNKAGNFGYGRNTDSRLTTTVRTPDGSASGWAGQPSLHITEIDGAPLGLRAIAKCQAWKTPVRLEPGQYTVILEPTAATDLLSLLPTVLNARAADEGRSIFSKKGGGNAAGDKLFPDFVTLRNDPADPRFPSFPWSSQLLPNTPVAWVENGVLKNLVYDRYWASKTNKPVTPVPDSMVLQGGDDSLDALIKGTDRGLLVTRFWYLRFVSVRTGQVTGLTRDGLFLIEDGKISKAVTNLRFNESPVRLLQNIEKIGKPERAQGAEGESMIVGPIKARNFTFSSVSDAV